MNKRILLLGSLLFSAFVAFAQNCDIEAMLKKIKSVSSFEKIEKADTTRQYYMMKVTQLLNPENPALGTFEQRVMLGHRGFDRPTVVVTEGYGGDYAFSSPRYMEELTYIMDANILFVEYRYFSGSMPEPCNWEYLTVKNSMTDYHNIITSFKPYYTGKWASTGISKGGQTTMFYTAYYPEDLDVSVPYVGPLCKGVEDGRHEPFLAEYAGTPQDREILKNFQIEFLKRRATIKPFFEELTAKEKYTYKIDMDAVYDYCVLEFPFAFWQWGMKTSMVPDPKTATDKEMFDFLVRASGPDYFAEGGNNDPFFVQAAKELGYYGYDTKPFKGLLTIKDAEGYLNKLFVPQTQTFKFDKYLYKKVKKFLAKTDSKMMFIYGQFDPWSAVMPVAPVKNEELKKKGKGRQTMKLYIEPNGSHRARISTLPDQMKKEAIATLKEWLEL